MSAAEHRCQHCGTTIENGRQCCPITYRNTLLFLCIVCEESRQRYWSRLYRKLWEQRRAALSVA